MTYGNPHVDQADWAGSALRDLTSLRWPRIAGFSLWNDKWANDDGQSHDTNMRVQDNPTLTDRFKRLVGARETVPGRPILVNHNGRPAYSSRTPGSTQNPASSPGRGKLLLAVSHGYSVSPAGLFTLPVGGGSLNGLVDV